MLPHNRGSDFQFLRVVFAWTTLVLLISTHAWAQVYRPPGQNYREVKEGRFRLIYPEKEDSAARATIAILEHQYDAISTITGGKIKRIPVILNGFNDQSNGFVTPYWYRIEVEVPSIKGKVLNPRLGGWFENVMPHELVHAAHLNVMPPGGLSWIVGLLWPDQGRSLHFNAHLGFHEGLAVYYESKIDSLGGRGNYPFFTNRLNANLETRHPWGVGTMLNPASHNRPGGGRHYMGGHAFMEWFHEEYGEETTAKVIAYNSRYPFFGLGRALWVGAGERPGKMTQKFMAQLEEKESLRLSLLRSKPMSKPELIPSPYRGPEVRRPKFLPDGSLMVHAGFYNRPTGFYMISEGGRTWEMVYETLQVEDFRYDVHPNGEKLLFANYRPSAIYNTTAYMDVYELDIYRKKVQRLTDHKRVFSPVYQSDKIMALQTDHESARLVYINKTKRTTSLMRVKPDNLVEVQPRPGNPDELAIIMNRNGTQGIWFRSQDAMADVKTDLPDIAFEGASIFDLEWSRDGRYLLFSADRQGVINLYEYDSRHETVTQITRDPFNAFEGAYNQRADEVAFVAQRGDYRVLATLKRTDFLNELVPDSLWKRAVVPKKKRLAEDRMEDLPRDREYHPLPHMSPRGIAVDYQESSFMGREFGFSFIGGDMLQRHRYTMRLTTTTAISNFAGVDLSYLYTGFWPGFTIDYSNYAFPSSGGLFRKVNEFAVGIPMRIQTEGNVRFSSLSITPRIQFQEYSLITPLNQNIMGSFLQRTSFRLNLAYNHRLMRFLRDAQPNSGSAFLMSLTRDLSSELSSGIISAASISGVQYLPLLNDWNHSLMLRADIITQNFAFYSIDNVLPQGFSQVDQLSPGSFRNSAGFRTRYTIPLAAPDRGGFLFPFYAQQIYTVLFTNTFLPLGESNDLGRVSRTMYGAGLRFVTGFSNFRVDIGVGIAYEFTRKNYFVSFGEF